MKLNVAIVNGQAVVTDGDTGAALPWVHTIDIVMAPGSAPALYLGTLDFGATITASASAPAPVPPAPAPSKP